MRLARSQKLAILDTTTGEVMERTLTHEGENVRESKIAALPLAPHTAYRRSELQALYALPTSRMYNPSCPVNQGHF
jgi:hypothetical protein